MDTRKEAVIKLYFQGLQSGSYDQVIKLFSQDGIVHSPLYGEIRADQFYRELFAVSSSSKITLKNIFLSSNNSDTAAAHFLYDWVLKNGARAPFECVDVFTFSADDKIVDLKIIYDASATREQFEAVNAANKK